MINTTEELREVLGVENFERGSWEWSSHINSYAFRTALIGNQFSNDLLEELMPYFYRGTADDVCHYQKLTEGFIEKFKNSVNWKYILLYQTLTDSFKEKYHEYLYLDTATIYCYHSSNRPAVDFYGGNDDENTLFMGVENEFDSPHYGENACTDKDKRLSVVHSNKNFGDSNYCYYMNDGSLSNGVEQITQPSTLEYYLSQKDCFKNIFDYFKSHKLKDRITCGLHVHFNRSYFYENEELYTVNLLYLVEKFWKEMVLYSRRNYKRIKEWSDKYDKTPEDVIKENYHDRYKAINLTNKNTIEFRMFKATSDVNIYMNTIKLVHNLVVRAKTNDIKGLQSMKFEELLTDKEMKDYWKKRTTKAKLAKVEKEFNENKVKSVLSDGE